jgi:hypothetical protein
MLKRGGRGEMALVIGGMLTRFGWAINVAMGYGYEIA